ncbi:hypothetical protein IH979_00300 [Patescibacteria group bacterium]|nr:hypothetical protein [Patescibacteria group bacterium]
MVAVVEGDARTKHDVRVKEEDYQRLTGEKISKEELVRKSFEFLLARERKESILPAFDLMLIGKYFPEYESEISSV